MLNPSRGRSFASAGSEHWKTPGDVFSALNEEFHFDLDPCPGPIFDAPGDLWSNTGMRLLQDGLAQPWQPFRAAYVNPPYGRELPRWIEKALIERRYLGMAHGVIVMLLPARTDTRWWHDMILPNAHDIRFLRGRIGFTGIPSKPEKDRQKQRSRAPFPSVVVVF